MSKQTKLSERPTRIPDVREAAWETSIPQYLREVGPLQSEPARSHRFGMLVHELLGVEPGFVESYLVGIEKYLKVKQKDRILRGKADNLFGNVIIEFETDIAKKRAEAEDQLGRYVAIVWSQEGPDARRPYLCIATDGVHFVTYSPVVADRSKTETAPDDVKLQVLEEANWAELKPHEVFYWLDRYFLRKAVLPPTTETIVRDFGAKSHAFQTTTRALLALWQQIKEHSAFKVIYDSWEKYLRIVYGSAIAGDELFIRHTYLATLAKLMAWMRITGSASLPADSEIAEILEGHYFEKLQVYNFVEEDFFSWLARGEAVKTGVSTARWLFSLLQNYNLRELSEDVLKSLYQELVDPETRHDLGEFYTPDWLAHRMVRKLLDTNPRGSVLDPACGSGTFLYLTVREKRQRLGDLKDTLYHILESVCGADVHPLAVIVAKTNYVLALGDLIKKRKSQITIPVYLADTIKLPQFVRQAEMVTVNGELVQQLPGYRVELDGVPILLPERQLQNVGLYDQAIELAKEFVSQSKGNPIILEHFANYLAAQRFPDAGDPATVHAMFAIAMALKQFIDADRDTIWAFVLKNAYKPLFFKRRFDFVVGNPPWIAFRFTDPTYQAFLKEQITQKYKLLRGRGENIPNLEIATLFLVRAAELYLKKGGTIAFVLPRSLFTADQHDGLRRRTFKFSEDEMKNLFWREIWDCENVAPLFNVPACVLVADKWETAPMTYPVPGQILGGGLKRKNANLAEAESALTVADVQFSLHTRGKHSFWATGKSEQVQAGSYYRKSFRRGADIHPRSFWFVQVKPSPLGLNPDLPPLETADRAMQEAKAAYKSVFFKGNVESRFLYGTLLSTDLLPFGHLDYRLVVLPIEPAGDHYRLIDVEEARNSGYQYLAQWLDRVEEEWTRRRSAKAERMAAIDWLDYRGKLTVQNPQAKYRVIYNTSGTFLTAAVVDNEPIGLEINGQRISAVGFAADTNTYFYETSNDREAFYLAAVLNAPVIDSSIKPMQSRGLWGPRHIHKKVFELPIPKFDATKPAHERLAELGQICSQKAEQWLAGGGAGKIKSIGRVRGMVRTTLAKELEEIDRLVKELLV